MICPLPPERELICRKAHQSEGENGDAGCSAIWGTVSEETKGKRSFCILSHSVVLPESSGFISLLVIGSQALLFGIDLRWNEIELEPFSDIADP